jgi:hypothetical protein
LKATRNIGGELLSSGPFRVFIGWDAREPEAFEVARFSLERRASIPVSVIPIKQGDLRVRGLYWREPDPLASTEFTYSRFLTPTLAGFHGWALYCDCDFLWLADVAELADLAEAGKAICCVKHDYRPTEATKMHGFPQSLYPRKNWSSLMLFDCGHPAVRRLTPEAVNHATAPYLHRMQWAADEEIGALPLEWNWLEGWNERPASGIPKAVHFTRGGPWLDAWQSVDYADRWMAERDAMRRLESCAS